MNITLNQIIVGLAVTLALPSAYALEKRWNQKEAVVTASANRVDIVKWQLQKLCEKYRMNFPCSSDRMSEQDKGRYKFYEQQYNDATKYLDKKMGKVE